MRNRKQLLRLGYLTDKSIDVEKLLAELRESGLSNFEIYSDIKVSANSKHKDFVIANEFIKNNFLKEEEAESIEGDRLHLIIDVHGQSNLEKCRRYVFEP